MPNAIEFQIFLYGHFAADHDANQGGETLWMLCAADRPFQDDGIQDADEQSLVEGALRPCC